MRPQLNSGTLGGRDLLGSVDSTSWCNVTYYPDLDRKTASVFGEAVRAVGWLARGHEYPRGPTPAGFVSALTIFRNSWGTIFQVLPGWPACMGMHRCEICDDEVDSGDIAIPAAEVLYVAPTMIVHYVGIHGYLPPTDFVRAVIACPAPATDAYVGAVTAIANRGEGALSSPHGCVLG